MGIGLIALILAGPQIKSTAENTEITYLIEPSLLFEPKITALIDSLPEDVKVRALVPGFPEMEDSKNRNIGYEVPPKYWQLAQEMETLRSDSIVVFTNAFHYGIKGMRPETRNNIRWVVFDSGENSDGIIEAELSGEEVTLLQVSGNQQNISFEKMKIPVDDEIIDININGDSIRINSKEGQSKLPLNKKKLLNIQIIYVDSLQDQMKYMEAAYRATGKYLDRILEIKARNISDDIDSLGYDHSVWLSEKPAPEYSSITILYRPDSLAGQLITPGSKKNIFHLTRLLNSENIIKEHLAEQLTALLDLHPNLEEKIAPYDKRSIDRDQLLPIEAANKKLLDHTGLLDVSPWLWAVLAVLLVIERIIAKYRRQ